MRKVIRLILLLLFQLFVLQTFSQQKEVRGSVADTAGILLENASVSIRRLPDSAIVKQAVTDKSGFVFKDLAAGGYIIITSYIGYQPDTVRVHLSAEKDIFKIPAIRVKPVAKTLVEVIVTGEITLVGIKNDTVIYNASSFKSRANATVEDLLKKLPGIQVDKDGNITYNGKKVEKVYIDGKEFSLINNTTITRNFTADMVDKVQAFDDKTDMEKITGINRGNAAVAGINLKLKKD